MVIFSQFTGALGLLAWHLKQRGLVFAEFNGTLSAADREAAVERFRGDARCRVMLTSLKAGGVGLNLQFARHVVLLDVW